MDGLDFHPYPIPQSQPFAQGYLSANDASVSNLPRIYQAFYDGFNGTPQPTIGQPAGGGLPLSLNEAGVQTDSTGRFGYVGNETSANAAGGVIGFTATETYQASWYQQMLDLVACDPNVRLVNIYHLLDEAGLAGWQSGLYYVDRSAKASAAVVHDWIANTRGLCQGSVRPWTPPGVPPRTTVPVLAPQSRTRIVVGVGGRLRIFDAVSHALRRVLAPFGAGYTGPLSVALGAVNRDAVTEFAVAEGAGSAGAVKVLDGKSGKPLAAYFPFPASFRGGATVALGDVTGDGRADVVVGSGPGMQSKVKVYDSSTRRAAVSVSPFARPFLGGVSQVKVLDGSTHLLLASFLGAPGSGAVSVAAG